MTNDSKWRGDSVFFKLSADKKLSTLDIADCIRALSAGLGTGIVPSEDNARETIVTITVEELIT